MHESFSFKLREDLSINCDANYPLSLSLSLSLSIYLSIYLSISLEISSSTSKNIILNTICRPPNGDMKQFETHFKDMFSENGKSMKNIVLAGDLTLTF